MEEKKENETGLQKVNNQPPYPYPPPYYTPCEEDEIDIYELWLILKKRKKWIFYTVGVFLLLAVLYLAVASPKYKSFAVYGWQGVSIPTDALSDAISNLNEAIKEKNYKLLETKLKLSPEDVKKIVSIEVGRTRNRKENQILKVNFVVKDRELIIPLSQRLESALNSLPLVKDAIKLKKEYLETRIKNDYNQIAELQKLKNDLMKKMTLLKDPQLVSAVASQIINVNQQILNKKADIEFTKLQLQNLKGIEITVPPTVPQKPYSPKPSLIIAIALTSGLFLGIFLAFFSEWLEEVRRKHAGENP